MKRFRVVIQPPAFDDLEGALRWIQERSPDAAARCLDGLADAINSLALSPERCGIAPENEFVDREIRQLRYGRRSGVYRVLFTVVGAEVRILHIRHAARRTMSSEEISGGDL